MVDSYKISCVELSIRISQNKIINRDNITNEDSESIYIISKHPKYDSIPNPIDK